MKKSFDIKMVVYLYFYNKIWEKYRQFRYVYRKRRREYKYFSIIMNKD